MQNSNLPKVLWLTNLPAHYRFPIWSRIAQLFELKVVFLLAEENWRNWTVPPGQIWSHEYLSLKAINIKEYDLIPSFRGARKILQDVDLVVIGGWETPFYARTLLLAKKAKIPVVQIYSSTGDSHRFKKGLVHTIRATLISKADCVVTFGSASKKAVESMGIVSEKIVALFNPVDVTWFSSFANKNRLSTSEGHRYIYVGQLIERKNVSTIINAFAEIRNRRDTLTIVGDGYLSQELKTLAARLDIYESVYFVGHKNQEELARLYSESNTLILASTNEVWGLVVNEALASGLHVVVTNKCGVAEFVKDMKGAFISSTDQLSLQKAMHVSSQQWNGYIQNPEILKFTPEKFAEDLMAIFWRLIVKCRKFP